MTDKPTRRDLMRPAQLLGLAFIAAVFAGIVTLVSMGFFQTRGDPGHALMVGAVVAGITFIATLVIIALLVLVIDPADVTKPVDRPLLVPYEDDEDAAPDRGAETGSASDLPDTPGDDGNRP